MARVKEKCRQGFAEGGKSGQGDARYRYVLQVSVVGPAGTLFPLMHEEMDVVNPETEKEDCELKCFQRLSQRLKREFPKLPICLVADALYCCQSIVATCQLFDWKYILTLKEGRQPTTWEEALALLPLNRSNHLRQWLGQDGQQGLRDFCWVEKVMLGSHQTNVILVGEITTEAATLYAYSTNFSNLTPQRVAMVVMSRRAGKASDRRHVQHPKKQRDRVGTCFLRPGHGLQKLLHHDAGRPGALDADLPRLSATTL